MIKSIARYYLQSLFYEIKPKDRYRAYLIYILIVAFCILFLHAFIEAPLTFFEMAVHVFFILTPIAFFCLLTELLGRLIVGSPVWAYRIDVWHLWVFGSLVSGLMHGATCYLEENIPIPIIARITQKHIESGHDAFTFIQAALLIVIILATLTEFLLRREPHVHTAPLPENNESPVPEPLQAEARTIERNEIAVPDQIIDIKIDGELKQISLSSTAYIQADENYCHLWQLENEDTSVATRYTVRSTLKELYVRLPNSYFMQTHRSYLINPVYAKKIKKINDKFHVLMVNDITVPVSRSRVKLVMEHYASLNPKHNACMPPPKLTESCGSLSKWN